VTERLVMVAVTPWWLCSVAGWAWFALPQLAWRAVGW
jgi:hypothetical protein